MPRLATQLVLLTLLLASVSASKVLVHDPSQAHVVRSAQQNLQPQHVATLVCSACKLTPPYHTSLPEEVQTVLSDDVFSRPKALVLLNIAGTGSDDETVQEVRDALGEGHSFTADMEMEGKTPASAASMLQSTQDIAAANPDVEIKVLDHTVLKGCDAPCLMGHLASAAAIMGATVHSGHSPRQGLKGSLHLAGGSVLDLDTTSAKLLALEMAGFMGALQQHLVDAQQQGDDQDLSVYEATFVGLQGLAAAHGQDEPLVAQARSGVLSLVREAKQQLEAKYGRDMLYQVSLLGDAPVPHSRPAQLLMWKEKSRRALLQVQGGGRGTRAASLRQDDVAASKQFATKAAAYGCFLIVLYFTASAIYCLVNMPFKQDTLLYGRSKSD